MFRRKRAVIIDAMLDCVLAEKKSLKKVQAVHSR